MRSVLTILCLVLAPLAARAEMPGPLAALAGEVDRGAAQVIHVWTPDATHSLATGPLGPGLRETRPGDRFYLASVSKVAVAAALLRLHEMGEIDVTDAASLHLPNDVVEGLGGLGGVRIAHLLNMTSGLPEYMSDAFFEALERDPAGMSARRSVAFAYGAPAVFAPGTDFDYVNLNYVLAQLILEEVTGQTLQGALQRLVLTPAGATRTEVFGAGPISPEDAVGLEDGVSVLALYAAPITGDGALVAPAGDVVALYDALFVARNLLRPETLALMLSDPLGVNYGMGIETRIEGGLRMLGHGGGFIGYSSYAVALPDVPAIGVILRADEDLDEDLLFDALDLILEAAP